MRPPPSALAVRRARAAQAEAERAEAERAEAEHVTVEQTHATEAPATVAPAPSRRRTRTASDAMPEGSRQRSRMAARETPVAPKAPLEPKAPVAPKAPFEPKASWAPDAPCALETCASPPPLVLAVPATLDDGDALQCGLHVGETLLVRGLCYVHVVRGTVVLAGARLTPASAPFAMWVPDVHPAAPLEAVDDALDEPCPTHAVVVRLVSARCGLEHMARICPLAGMNPFGTERWSRACTFVLEREAHHYLQVPPAWADMQADLVAAATKPLALVVRGAKNTGKSTFARLALHALLTAPGARHVAFLELDPGQPEYGPPGLLALHVLDATHESGCWAPSWCTARRPVRAYMLGDVTPRDDPARYLAAARDLIEFFHTEVQHSTLEADGRPARRRGALTMPFVVNTHGWVKGLGLDLLQQVCALVHPTHVADMSTPLPPVPGASPCVYALPMYNDTTAWSAPVRRLNAAESRVLSILSYLHMTQLPRPGEAVPPVWDWTCPLVARTPFIVDVDEGLPAGCAVLDARARVDEALRLLALNGRLAAIVQAPPSAITGDHVWRTAFARGEALVPGPGAPALGLALVRSIDRDNGAVHLVTPISGLDLRTSVEQGAGALGLVAGALDLPIWGALDEAAWADVVQGRGAPTATLAGVPREAVPYISWPRELLSVDDGAVPPARPVGAGPRKVRRNLMRRRQQIR
ncbi:Polynucleotide 5'-hydroxyl-kinase grc3 [Malassezia nana]|uniref:Polynucleotide 5'-hydroxyl-kinase GRC3 n=1 Tax=Malassezia nana TaxID=180528 RepID=A0AAF0J2R5_9BASI|nr:Polynucleotide 5'-hydroxyl-kinase grc3 [Malassezia nana]